MREYDITPEDITAAYSKKATRPTARKSPATSGTTAKRVVPANYRHPDTGENWTGRGKAHRWIVPDAAEGKAPARLLIHPYTLPYNPPEPPPQPPIAPPTQQHPT